MNDLIYNKPNHFLDSVSVWLDLDSFVYIVVVLLLAWGITCLIRKISKKDKIGLIKFTRRYMLLCAFPVFALFGVQLIMSGIYVKNNIIITFLPLLYGAIIQLLCLIPYWIKK